MSTRGNVIFISKWYMNENELDENDFKNLTIDCDTIKESYKIYVHSDMYPSGALPDLFEFLNMQGAKHRCGDTAYLSGYFCAYQAFRMLPYTRAMGNDDFNPQDCTNPSFEDMKQSRDWFGFGIIKEPSEWVDYSYVIVPKNMDYYTKVDESNFDIYIYDGGLDKFICKINTNDDLESFKNEKWWY